MKSIFFLASIPAHVRLACIGLVFVLVANTVQAQATATARSQNHIAVIDIKKILENHTRYKAAVAQLKTRFEAIGAELQKERRAIEEKSKQLLEYQVGTPDYNKLDELITREKAEFTIKAQRHQKEIQHSEAQILWTVYNDIRVETKRFCDHNGIGLVVQFNSDDIDSNKPREVINGIRRPIVYNSPNLDITRWILEALNQSAGQPEETATGLQGVRPPGVQR